ncbi:MAG: fructose,6-bisphosphatase [Chthoniobacter sp.]|jgi:fructose-1,6-bisphosphatase II|nr:fructose,6-bisphosphatase [Chthoniobacter sp.]
MFHDPERTVEFEFVRATENAALNAMHWIGRGDKEAADAAACDAIYGVFDLVNISGEVVIGEGIKDNAPGIFLGDKLGTWKEGTPHFDIALDPVDGTTNISKGMANSISVIAAAEVPPGAKRMLNIPSYYCNKLSYGPEVTRALRKLGLSLKLIDLPLQETLQFVSSALGKRMAEVVVLILDRPRNQYLIDGVRATGASLRMVSDGDITAAVAPALPDSGVDLYVGIGGTPEGILTATALRALGGDIQMRMWFRDEKERTELRGDLTDDALSSVYSSEQVIEGDSAIFCATGISDSPLLPGVKLIGRTAITHSILMRARSQTVRYIRAVHNLEHKTIHLRSAVEDQKIPGE